MSQIGDIGFERNDFPGTSISHLDEGPIPEQQRLVLC